MFKKISIMTLVALSGCASMTGTKNQPISVQTIYDNKEISGVNCTLVNDAGKWFVTSPGSVTINKSTGDLAVDCKRDANTAGHETVVSKSNGAVWGNILAGGGIGYIVDRNTGAGFDYPNSIVVMLRKIGESVGLADSTPVDATSSAAPTMIANAETAEEKLGKLKKLYDSNLITKDVYQERQTAILSGK